MREKQVALLLLFSSIISMVSGAATAYVAVKAERMYQSSTSQEADDDALPAVLQKALHKAGKRVPSLKK